MKNLYKDLAKLTPQKGVIKPELAHVFVSPTHTWVTNGYYVVRVADEHPGWKHTHAIPAWYAEKCMVGAVLTENEDGTLSGTITHKRDGVEILTPPEPQVAIEDLRKRIIDNVDKVSWDLVEKYTGEAVKQMPTCNAEYLASLVEFVGKYTNDFHKGVEILHGGKGAPIHITDNTRKVEAVLMPFNR